MKKTIGRIILDDLSNTKSASSIDHLEEAVYISDGLNKIASFSLNESTEISVKEIMKIASGCIKDLVKVVKEMQKEASVKSLTKLMLDKGMINSNSFQEKVSELMKKDNNELSIIKETVDLYGGKSFSLFEKQASSSVTKLGMFDSVMKEG